MTISKDYRKKAAEAILRRRRAKHPADRRVESHLEESWRRLAKTAEWLENQDRGGAKPRKP